MPLLVVTVPSQAQNASAGNGGKDKPTTSTLNTPVLLDEKGNALTVPLDVLHVGSAPVLANTSPGVGTLETLRGNGSRAGYTLAHCPVLASSVSLYVSGKRLLLNQDYWLDATSGALFFLDAVRPSDSISVSYRYLDGTGVSPQTRSAAGLQFGLGDSTRLSLLYGLNSQQENGLNLSLNGLQMDSLFGPSNRSHFSGIAYLSNLSRPNAQSASWRDVLGETGKPKAPAAQSLLGSGHLLTQSLSLQTGGLRMTAGFQDISKQFAGFADLKKGAGTDKTTLEQLTQLEKEKGLQRLGFGLGLGGNPNSKTPGGLALEWDQIQDKGANDAKKPIPAPALADKTLPAPKTLADTLPALRRESLSLQTGALNFSLTRRDLSGGFKRLGDLSDGDKNALALDIRRQFDGSAKVEQVTQADRDQLAQTTGLNRETLFGRLQFGKSDRDGVFTFGQYAVGKEEKAKGESVGALLAAPGTNAAPNTLLNPTPSTKHQTPNTPIFRQSLGFDSAHLQFSMLSQEIQSGFARIGELSDTEKAQFGKESGLKRDQMSLVVQTDKTTKIGFDTLKIGGTSDAVTAAVAQAVKDSKDLVAAQRTAGSETTRQSFHIETKGFKFATTQAHTDKDFTRAADLALPDADKQQIEKERGFDRTDYTLHLDALKGLTLDTMTYKATNAVDKLLRDMARSSIVFAPTKTLSLSYASDHDLTTLAPDDKGERKRAGGTHSLLSLKAVLARNATLNFQREETATMDPTKALDASKPTQKTIAETLNVGMPKDKLGLGLDYAGKRIAFQDGKYDNTVEFNIHAKPTKSLSVQVSQREQDRLVDTKDTKAEEKLDGKVKTEAVELDFQAAKNFDIILGSSQTDAPGAPRLAAEKLTQAEADKAANDNATVAPPAGDKPIVKKPPIRTVPILTDSNTVTVGLKSEPAKNVALAAKFDEVHEESKNTKDVADVSIGNAKPLTFGPLKDLTIKAGYASLNDKRLLQNETMTGHADWKMWKHEFLLDYGGFSKLDGTTLNETVARTYSFKTDPSPQRWFHGGFYYKLRTLADGKEKHIRRFTADAALNKNTHFAYTYGTLPEDDKGIIQPLETIDLALKHTFRPKTSLSLFYRLNDQQDKGNWTRGLGVSAEGTWGHSSKWSLEFSRDASGYYGIFSDHSNHLRLALDHQISADNFLSLSADYRAHEGKDKDGQPVHDEVRATLDLSRKF